MFEEEPAASALRLTEALFFTFKYSKTGEADILGVDSKREPSKPSTNKAGAAKICQIPSRGSWALVQTRVPSTVLAWGAVNLVTGHTGRDSLGDWAKNLAANSSTMKGLTAKVREGLPVNLMGDGAEL